MSQALNITNANAPGITSVGGIVPIKSAKQLLDEERAAAVAANNEPVVQNLAAHVRKCWMYARAAKEYTIEQKMLKSLRQRRGECEGHEDLRHRIGNRGDERRERQQDRREVHSRRTRDARFADGIGREGRDHAAADEGYQHDDEVEGRAG